MLTGFGQHQGKALRTVIANKLNVQFLTRCETIQRIQVGMAFVNWCAAYLCNDITNSKAGFRGWAACYYI